MDSSFVVACNRSGIKEVVSAPRSLRQNKNAERLIGSIGRECLEHVVVLSRRHFCRVLKSCFAYESSFANALGAGQRRSRATSNPASRRDRRHSSSRRVALPL